MLGPRLSQEWIISFKEAWIKKAILTVEFRGRTIKELFPSRNLFCSHCFFLRIWARIFREIGSSLVQQVQTYKSYVDYPSFFTKNFGHRSRTTMTIIPNEYIK